MSIIFENCIMSSSWGTIFLCHYDKLMRIGQQFPLYSGHNCWFLNGIKYRVEAITDSAILFAFVFFILWPSVSYIDNNDIQYVLCVFQPMNPMITCIQIFLRWLHSLEYQGIMRTLLSVLVSNGEIYLVTSFYKTRGNAEFSFFFFL